MTDPARGLCPVLHTMTVIEGTGILGTDALWFPDHDRRGRIGARSWSGSASMPIGEREGKCHPAEDGHATKRSCRSSSRPTAGNATN